MRGEEGEGSEEEERSKKGKAKVGKPKQVNTRTAGTSSRHQRAQWTGRIRQRK